MVKIYYTNINDIIVDENLINTLPLLRLNYVLTIKDEIRKKQSVLVWKLLEHALKMEVGPLDNFEFNENNGAWSISNHYVKFSLSHSKDLVAVAVSDNLVGVDVEICSDKILKIERMFPDINKSVDKIEILTLLWTKKESAFKANNLKNFVNKRVSFGKDVYYISANCVDNNAEFIQVNIKNYLKERVYG